ERIVQAARVSYGEGTKTVREDSALIDYLLRNHHTSPFEQVILTFHVKMPIFVARQSIRHRTARLNEISGRYSVMRDEFYVPRRHEVRFQSKVNRQGGDAREVPTELQERVLELLAAGQSRSYDEYETLLDDEVARELARINLPLSLYTEMYWQCDLNNLVHFLRLRLDWHAQSEIRAYEAFEEHVLHGRSFSRTELRALVSALDMAELGKALAESGLRKTRRAELLAKLGLSPGDLPDAEVATATPRRGGTPQES